MELRSLFLFTILLCGSSAAFAQITATTDQARRREQMMRDAQARQEQQQSLARLRAINQANHQYLASGMGRVSDVPLGGYKQPTLTQQDIEAVSINPADLNRYKEFLSQSNTGIMRLHNASICSPERLIIQAESACPNNVVGKATGYSFRTGDYKNIFYSDIFFAKEDFSARGGFTLGIFSNLGDIDLQTLSLSSEGVKQLADFQASADKAEIKRQYGILTKGLQIGENIYKTKAAAAENTSYVLRTIAYKGRVMRKSGGFRYNTFQDDQRKDVLLVFRVVRRHDDGSLTLLYKELSRKAVPQVVLEKSEAGLDLQENVVPNQIKDL